MTCHLRYTVALDSRFHQLRERTAAVIQKAIKTDRLRPSHREVIAADALLLKNPLPESFFFFFNLTSPNFPILKTLSYNSTCV